MQTSSIDAETYTVHDTDPELWAELSRVFHVIEGATYGSRWVTLTQPGHRCTVTFFAPKHDAS